MKSLIVFKEQGMISLWTFFQLVEMVMTSQHHQPSGSNWFGVYVLVGSIVNFFDLGGANICKTTQRMLSIVSEEELKVLYFV